MVGGVLSGTSGDGIDVALAKVDVDLDNEGLERVVSCTQKAFETRPFPPGVVSRVREALDGAPLGAREIACLSRDLGFAFGSVALDCARSANLELDLVGSHGLTIYHHDGSELDGLASMQIGDGDHVAEAARCSVVSDFRQRDLAAGGEGAPISILADDIIFRNAPRPTAILNLGGLANLSWLAVDAEPLAFDTGPAGSLLDGFARNLIHLPLDRGGEVALSGHSCSELLTRWMRNPFFEQAPPKSTGRDTFGSEWVRSLLASAAPENRPADLLATAVEFVAETVAAGLSFLPERPDCLWLAGGGVHNSALVAALGRTCGVPVASTEELGVDPDAREALVFAILAARCAVGEPVTRTSATGAAAGRVLGKISQSYR